MNQICALGHPLADGVALCPSCGMPALTASRIAAPLAPPAQTPAPASRETSWPTPAPRRSRQAPGTVLPASPTVLAAAGAGAALVGLLGYLALSSGPHPGRPALARAASATVSVAPQNEASPSASADSTVTAWCSAARQTAETFSAAQQAQAGVATAADNISPYDRSGQLQAKINALDRAISLYKQTSALFAQLSSAPPRDISADMTAITTVQPTTVVASDRDRLVAAKANVNTYSSSRCDTLLDVDAILTQTASASAGASS